MFRINASEAHARIPRAAAGVIVALALGLYGAGFYQVLTEYRMLGSRIVSSELVDHAGAVAWPLRAAAARYGRR
jgi:hypothetical protein